MNNPWLDIPLSDYESHMSLPTVAQSDMLAAQLSDALHRFTPQSVAVIGCAGGNGFDRIPSSTTRVVGVDINPRYIAAAAARYLGRVPGLELHVADIQSGSLPFAPVDLIYAALVFEYVQLPAAFRALSSACRPGGHLIAVLQQPSSQAQAVTPSPHRSLQALAPLMRLISATELAECAAAFGFVRQSERTVQLETGKAFVVPVFHRTAG